MWHSSKYNQKYFLKVENLEFHFKLEFEIVVVFELVFEQ